MWPLVSARLVRSAETIPPPSPKPNYSAACQALSVRPDHEHRGMRLLIRFFQSGAFVKVTVSQAEKNPANGARS
jgi:hypothetical protein